MTTSAPRSTLRISRRTLGVVALGAIPAVLTACGDNSGSNHDAHSGSAGASDAGGSNKPLVFASTSVWGALASAVAGGHAEVISAINSPEQDPHDFEPSARQKADVARAAVIIVNGGGYDDWALTLAKGSKATVLNAVDISGLKKDGEEEFNEHVFYDVDTAVKLAGAVEKALSEAAPEHAAHFRSSADELRAQLGKLQDVAKKFASAHPGLKAVATEPVAGYLLEDLGIQDITPEEYVEQSETDAGPSAAAVHETQQLLEQKKANILILNAQTEDATSTTLEKAATSQGIPVAKVYETLPAGVETYVGFISGAQKAIEESLA